MPWVTTPLKNAKRKTHATTYHQPNDTLPNYTPWENIPTERMTAHGQKDPARTWPCTTPHQHHPPKRSAELNNYVPGPTQGPQDGYTTQRRTGIERQTLGQHHARRQTKQQKPPSRQTGVVKPTMYNPYRPRPRYHPCNHTGRPTTGPPKQNTRFQYTKCGQYRDTTLRSPPPPPGSTGPTPRRLPHMHGATSGY